MTKRKLVCTKYFNELISYIIIYPTTFLFYGVKVVLYIWGIKIKMLNEVRDYAARMKSVSEPSCGSRNLINN